MTSRRRAEGILPLDCFRESFARRIFMFAFTTIAFYRKVYGDNAYTETDSANRDAMPPKKNRMYVVKQVTYSLLQHITY